MASVTGAASELSEAGLVAPDYGGSCLDAVLPAAFGALGVDVVPDGGPVAAHPGGGAAERLGVPRADRVCVVLVDGLGHRLLVERAGHAPFLRRRLPDARVLTVGYPSTTAASMGLFGTGCGAGRTGLAGYTVRNPATGGLANLVSWEGAGRPQDWQRAPSFFTRAVAAGATVTSVGPARFAGSGLTEAALRGADYVAAERLWDRVDATVRLLRRPVLVYLYWGDVDKVGHHHGWRSPQWGDELSSTDAELGRLARSVPRGTVLLITADHGMVDVDHDALMDVATTPALSEGVELVSGEPRATHVHVADGRVEEVAARWRSTLGRAAVVVRGEEAVEQGWFGPVADHVRPMIGDLVVAATGRGGVVDSRTQTPHSLLLRGMHGSFTPEEMLVPLVVVA
jgi:hypothetical protein